MGCDGPRSTGDAELPPTVLLVSLDGFRWDYPALYETPTLDSIAARGVHAEALVPVFPTKTFPNHYTQVTGLYPEHHGIVANTMHDPRMDASFSLGNQEAIEDPRWWGGEPLWVTAEEQGQIAATYFWPGSEAPIGGVRPTYWKTYDGDVSGEARVRQVLDWLDLPPGERPTFITLYLSRVDHAGHVHGPRSDEVAEAVREVDTLLGRLLDGLAARGLTDEVNLIVTSDHGMTPTSPERVVMLDEYVDLANVEIVAYSPVLMLYAEAGQEEDVIENLRRAPHLTVYRKENVPEVFHFADHPRVPPIIAIADEGWSITTRGYYAENPERFDGGGHGYDHRLTSMHGIFYARGPAFTNGKTVAPFSSVHLYDLIAHLLGLDPAPNDGSLDSVRVVLKAETNATP